MTKAQRLLKKWDKENTDGVTKDWLKANTELGIYLGTLANQGKLYSINTNGNLESVSLNHKNRIQKCIKIDDIYFEEDEASNWFAILEKDGK